MRPLPAREPDTDRRWRFGRRPIRTSLSTPSTTRSIPSSWGVASKCASQREIVAIALDTVELARRHERSFAKHRTVTAVKHARKLRQHCGEGEEPLLVEQRSLSVYDQLIA
jgi:hypothetical protein